ncbi:MAG: RNA polymerase sigma factor (sigma-70 family) [Candidatus Promineifilaceae bacterium]
MSQLLGIDPFRPSFELLCDLFEESVCQTRLVLERTVEGQSLKFRDTSKTRGTRDAELEALIAEYETQLLRFATRIVNDADAARDVVQQAFLKLVAVWKDKNYSRITNPKSWLFRVTHNLAVDHVRRDVRRHALHEKQAGDPVFSHVSTRHVDSEAKHREVLRHLDVLTPLEKHVLLLRLEEDLSYKEIARITKRTQGNVGCVLHHAVKKIADQIRRANAVVTSADSMPEKNGRKKLAATDVLGAQAGPQGKPQGQPKDVNDE